MPSLNNVTTADGYTDANTIKRPGIARLNFDISNAAIYYQLGDDTAGEPRWLPEIFLPPSSRSLDRRCNGVRVRSAVAGTPAQVTVDAVPQELLP